MRSSAVLILSKFTATTMSCSTASSTLSDIAGSDVGMKNSSVTKAATANVVTPKNLSVFALSEYINIALTSRN